MIYKAPYWQPGGHVQTIWPALYGPFGRHTQHTVRDGYRRERWATPDEQDFVDVDWLAGKPSQPLLVLFHGLEGSAQSHYALAFADFAQRHGLGFVVPHFRGCGGEINLAPRAYHSGDFEEIGWVLQRLRRLHAGPLLVVGVSLGGNALLRWAQEMGEQASGVASALCSICAPLDLTASGHAMGRGLNRQIYTRMFLSSMKPKALRKLAQHPGLFSQRAMLAARDLYDFDNVFTAPLHGFKNTLDYWKRASAKPGMAHIRVPALVINALNDPFVPASSLPSAAQVGRFVKLWQPHQGGHVGFGGVRCRDDQAVAEQVGLWLLSHLGAEPGLTRESPHG